MRLTDEGKRLLETLAQRRGVSQTAIVEMLVRAEAKAEGIQIEIRHEGPQQANA
jgi:hypothetical protein